MERFVCDIQMYGRRIRIDEDDDVLVLRNFKCKPEWYKKKLRLEKYNAGKKQESRGYIMSVVAFKDRYNQHEMARTKNGDYPPRVIPYSLLLAIKYLSSGIDLGYKGFIVSHKNKIVTDNSIENLEWISRDDYFKTRVAKGCSIGSKIGLWTVIGNERVESYNSQSDNKFYKTFVKVRCICGEEDLIEFAQLKRCQRKMCCSKCIERYGSNNIKKILLETKSIEPVEGSKPIRFTAHIHSTDYDFKTEIEKLLAL